VCYLVNPCLQEGGVSFILLQWAFVGQLLGAATSLIQPSPSRSGIKPEPEGCLACRTDSRAASQRGHMGSTVLEVVLSAMY